jgi:hypothetical protein
MECGRTRQQHKTRWAHLRIIWGFFKHVLPVTAHVFFVKASNNLPTPNIWATDCFALPIDVSDTFASASSEGEPLAFLSFAPRLQARPAAGRLFQS